ncbi:ferredoxin subunits of nitrite reductase and ring-hydroxylating dioxygenases [Candidatus Brocadia sinica JPN1]|uniref:Ferredoxin subunits of nitrite reductase and ring-hydroxylating dioxygenases n=1 Tax=Candidatus Brocadia sinica JPN1 TaxID=1197129 RepID=A0ABQ0K2J7_9BACT|nr:ferredoxin subunits of nitrite reductase and ring-hydroxylating dioxygenases [Candidatus Brocadia sinica JPN1]
MYDWKIDIYDELSKDTDTGLTSFFTVVTSNGRKTR